MFSDISSYHIYIHEPLLSICIYILYYIITIHLRLLLHSIPGVIKKFKQAKYLHTEMWFSGSPLLSIIPSVRIFLINPTTMMINLQPTHVCYSLYFFLVLSGYQFYLELVSSSSMERTTYYPEEKQEIFGRWVN